MLDIDSTSSRDCATQAVQPDYFLTQYYYPATPATERAVEALRLELGLQNRATSREAVSGFLVACKALVWRGGCFLGFAHDKNTYGRGHATYRRMREALVALGYITLVRKGYKDLQSGETFVSVYKILIFPHAALTALRFEHLPPPQLVTVREPKGTGTGKFLSPKQCESRFGADYDIAVFRMTQVTKYLAQHPLVILGNAYKGLSRRFNDGRLDRGGRMYAGYSNLPKAVTEPWTGEVFSTRATATIDGEGLAYIDISACFLCIVASMNGHTIDSELDAYGSISFVVDDDSRDFAKVLVSTLIGNGGRKSRYTKKMKEDFAGVIQDHKISYFTDAIYQAYPYLDAEIDALEVMFRESEVMVRTIERCCMVEGFPVFPLHDAIFVKLSDVDRAKAILSDEFSKSIGFPPRLSVEIL